MIRFAAILVLFACLGAGARADSWSKPVNGLQARWVLERGRTVNGTRLLATYLEIRNVFDVANPLYVWYDPTTSLKAQVYDESGQPVPMAPCAASVLSPSAHLLSIPYHGTLRFEVTAFGYSVGRDSSLLIGLHSGAWTVPKGQHPRWLLGGTLVAIKPPAQREERIFVGSLEIPRVAIPIDR